MTVSSRLSLEPEGLQLPPLEHMREGLQDPANGHFRLTQTLAVTALYGKNSQTRTMRIENRLMREINAVAIPHPAGCGIFSSGAMLSEHMAWKTLLPPSSSASSRAPQWIRHDLDPKDDAIRTLAEQILAAMIANVLREGSDDAGKA